MEIKKKVILRSVAGEYMLMPVGETVSEYNGIFMLTESAYLLWKAITDGGEKEDLEKVLKDEYGIDDETAEADVTEFIEKLHSYGIV
ncbi:MAG: PqqD family protein [Clostridia bacterium]|nr:PqqD family protein [Clostridia bacterium]